MRTVYVDIKKMVKTGKHKLNDIAKISSVFFLIIWLKLIIAIIVIILSVLASI